MTETLLHRRAMLVSGAAAVTALAGISRAIASPLALTADQQLGPFYPVLRPLDQDSDLTRVAGHRGVAKGEIIDVSGRVLDMNGRPIPGARIDIWQANSLGRYDHPGDQRDDAPLDPDFQGSGIAVADAEGRYRFRTIKPGAYPIGGGRVRTPHLHLDITGRSQRLTTQCYFPGDALNAADNVYPKDPGEAATLTLIAAGSPADAPAVRGFTWDIVLLT